MARYTKRRATSRTRTRAPARRSYSRASRAPARRPGKRTARPAAQTIRIVIEQPGANALARPALGVKEQAPKKGQF